MPEDAAPPLRSEDFRLLFESSPGLLLVLTPSFHIVAVSDAYCQATMTTQASILGRHLFDVFPDNPNDPHATGVTNLRNPVNNALQHKAPHTMRCKSTTCVVASATSAGMLRVTSQANRSFDTKRA